MPFPTTIDPSSLRQIARFITGTDRDTGRLALALYDLGGFGLGHAFPHAAYVADMAQTHPLVAQIEAELVANPAALKPLFENLLQVLGPILLNLLLQFLKLKTTATP